MCPIGCKPIIVATECDICKMVKDKSQAALKLSQCITQGYSVQVMYLKNNWFSVEYIAFVSCVVIVPTTTYGDRGIPWLSSALVDWNG
jgi:hypothetical protein